MDSMTEPVRQRLILSGKILLVVLASSELARLVFLVAFSPNESKGFLPAAAAMLTGLRFDLSAFAQLFALPLVLLWLLGHFRFIYHMVWLLLLWLHFLWLAVTFGDLVFYAIAHRRSVAEFFALFSSFRDFWAFVTGSIFYIVAGLATSILLLYFLYRKEWKLRLLPLVWKHAIAAGTLLLLGTVIAVRGGLQGRPINVTNAFTSGDYFLGNAALNPVFAAIQHFYRKEDLPHNAKGNSPLAEVRRQFALSQEKFVSDEYPFFRKHESMGKKPLRKNVVIFIMESWSAADLGYFGNHYKATPNFDRIAAAGYSFNNALAYGNRSITALPVIVSSIAMPFGRPYTTSSYAHNRQRGLGTIFREAGYATYFVTGYKAGSQGFSSYMRVAGFENIITKENLGFAAKDEHVWGVYDHLVFMRLHEILLQEKKPFLAVVTSLHPHHPYQLPPDYAEKDFYRGFARAAHFNALRYADYALGRFFALAEKSSYFAETIFVITADHTYGQNGVFHQYHVPLVFYSPNFLPVEKRSELASQLDILPTLLSMLRITTLHAAMGKALWPKPPAEWAVADLDSSMAYFRGRYALITDRERPLALYDWKSDPIFTNNLITARPQIAEDLARQWFSYLNFVSQAIRQNRIARDF